MEVDPKRVEEGFGHKPLASNDDEEVYRDNKVAHIDNDEREGGERSTPAVDQRLLPEETKAAEVPPLMTTKQKSKRVATLDVFRGLTIVLMILVDDAGEVYARIDHSPWNGCTLADFVMPFFLFIVGVAIALALKRIALVYLVIAQIETLTSKLRPNVLFPGHFSIFKAYKWQWLGGFVSFFIYIVTTYTLYVPDWSFVVQEDNGLKRYTVKCGMRGHLGPACNAVGYVDREVWGINHIYKQPVWSRLKACTLSSPSSGPFREGAPSWCRGPFEPEGLLSSISAILSGTIGIHYGHILIHFKLSLLTSSSIASAMFVSQQIDVWGLRSPFLFLEWIGMNAMLVFVLGAQAILAGFINGWYYKTPDNNLVSTVT
ncbi:hypothetical protein LguiB_015782 [Lonicera macranthoides]